MEQEPGPYIFKLHIQALSLKELSMNMIRASVEALVSLGGSKINISFYAKKK